jgi:hypothetical protein
MKNGQNTSTEDFVPCGRLACFEQDSSGAATTSKCRDDIRPPHEPRSRPALRDQSAHFEFNGSQRRLTSAATVQGFKARKIFRGILSPQAGVMAGANANFTENVEEP